ncbi:MAG: bifunctional 2-C-methyl-D-erythritol 4-phosphate cytidylyltransferase/2-C-methyl-D-erythritol 2,4-cyclodiphosphate synthase [Sphingorhabdus sp.]
MTPVPRIAAIIVAAGSGTRAGTDIPKQYCPVAGKPMVWHSVQALAAHLSVGSVVVVIGSGQQEMAAQSLVDFPAVIFVEGGATRRDSVNAGLNALQGHCDLVLIHDAARPFLPAKVIDDLIEALDGSRGAVPALPVVDSLSRGSEGKLEAAVARQDLWRIQTPQAFHYSAICDAHEKWSIDKEATDDASMALAAGFDVTLVAGAESLGKITFADDFVTIGGSRHAQMTTRMGSGYDVHRLEAGEDLWLCGIKLDHDKGLAGHSDADVALHALTDAILGAVALGDIGQHFPPSDRQWRGASSDRFLAHAAKLVRDRHYEIGNVDLTIICEAPKIGPHRDAMRARVAEILSVAVDQVSIKATTTEGLGFTGRGEGIAAQATAILTRNQEG